MPETVTTTDDALRVYRERDLSSTVITNLRKGVDIHLGSATVFEGREWIEATVEDDAGYVLGSSARGHTTLGILPAGADPIATRVLQSPTWSAAPRPPVPSQRSRKVPEVPVAPATIVGAGLLLVGYCLVALKQDPLDDAAVDRLVGKILLLCGATLVGGGVFVFFAELVSTPIQDTNPKDVRIPKWGYVFAGLCLILGLAGGLIGAAFGFPASSVCIVLSRTVALSVPRRIYGCILWIGFSWVGYFFVVHQLFSTH